MRNKHMRILWVDPQHLADWRPTISYLQAHGATVDTLLIPGTNTIVAKCQDKDILVYHTGTNVPADTLIRRLQAIRAAYPKLKIGIVINSVPEYVKKLIHFQIGTPTSNNTVLDILKENCGQV